MDDFGTRCGGPARASSNQAMKDAVSLLKLAPGGSARPVMLALVAGVACYLPARHALCLDPSAAINADV